VTLDTTVVAKALGARLTDIEVAVDRYGSFAHGPGATVPPPALADGQIAAAARDLVLRALGMLADPIDHRILCRLAEGDTPLVELATLLDLPRVAVWERVNDLLQVGLVGHGLEDDRAGLSAAGAGLVGLVDELVAGIVAEDAR
jgi:hypothetical protein